MSNQNDYIKLLQFCTTNRQREVVEALHSQGSYGKAAKSLGCAKSTVGQTIERLKHSAARRGWSPEHDMTKTVPEGFHLKGTSTLYDKEGKQVLQWSKTSIDHKKQQQLMEAAIQALAEEIPRAEKTKTPEASQESLINVYTITDYHFGMLAWGEEAGEDWDTDIAEQTLLAWFSQAIKLSPDTNKAVFANIGDFLHWDGFDAVTPASKHVLDADTRFQKLVRVVIRVIRQVVSMLLHKHQELHIIMADANHDPASGVWLREFLSAFYDNEPRITVDNTADSYYCHVFGKVSLFWHHGHKKKPESIDDVFVAKFRSVFGDTKFSYAHMGHMHHDKLLETNLMTVEQHRTLAANDAYASRGGWISGRGAKVITYHASYGEVSRVSITPDMLKG